MAARLVRIWAALRPSAGPETARCRSCTAFAADAAALEALLPGLQSLGSGYAAVRSGDGLCQRRGHWVGGNDRCALHRARPHRSDAAASLHNEA